MTKLLVALVLLAAVVAMLLPAAAQQAEFHHAAAAPQESWSPAALMEHAASASDAAIVYDGEAAAVAMQNVQPEQEEQQPRAQRASGQPQAQADMDTDDSTAMLELGADAERRRRRGRAKRHHGWGISPRPVRRVQQRLPSPRLTGAAATLTRTNVRCVLCQFVVEKVKNGLTNAPASASLIEAFSFASVSDKARIEAHVQEAAFAAQRSEAIPPVFQMLGTDPQRRFRHTDILAHRDSTHRFTALRSGAPGAETDAHRAAYLKLYAAVYASFEELCAKRMPLAYLPYCNDMLKSYRFFAQGINYGDRAEQVCMQGNFCDHRAYVRRVTHDIYQREPGDA